MRVYDSKKGLHGVAVLGCALAILLLNPGALSGCGDAPADNSCEALEPLYTSAQESMAAMPTSYRVEHVEGELRVDFTWTGIRRYAASTSHQEGWIRSATAKAPCNDNAQIRVDADLTVIWAPLQGEEEVLARDAPLDGFFTERTDRSAPSGAPTTGTLTLNDFESRQWTVAIERDDNAPDGFILNVQAVNPNLEDPSSSVVWLEVSQDRLVEIDLVKRKSN